MKHLFLLSRPAIAIVALTSAHISFASNQEVQEGPGEALAKMIKKGEALATPGSSHAFLEQLAGKWETTSIVMGSEPQFGSAKAEMILGGRFLEMSYQGNFVGLALKGKLTLGFDNYKNKYTAIFLDNLSTSIRTAEGMLDQTGKVLSLWGTMDEWMTDEHDKPVMYRYTFLNDLQIDFEVHDLSIVNGDTLVIKVVYTKSDQN
ncbi:MAG: DUF1579 family protein [Phycisphaerales bacterium]|jgi:hypothetical protein|nr:DUF1579 family protein [Phycisphaerales bacterium]MDP6693520.1 DUF1579 family protein [Phycisphaerales bacterium]